MTRETIGLITLIVGGVLVVASSVDLVHIRRLRKQGKEPGEGVWRRFSLEILAVSVISLAFQLIHG